MPKYDIYCPICEDGKLKQTLIHDEYICITCNAEFVLTLTLTRKPTYRPIGFVCSDKDEPYP
jgi:hypothetical protein